MQRQPPAPLHTKEETLDGASPHSSAARAAPAHSLAASPASAQCSSTFRACCTPGVTTCLLGLEEYIEDREESSFWRCIESEFDAVSPLNHGCDDLDASSGVSIWQFTRR